MAFSSSSALWKVPRRIIRQLIRAKNRSTWFNQERLVGLCMGAVVIHGEVDVLIGGELPLEMIQEPDGLPAPVALPTTTDDLTIEDVERGKQVVPLCL